MVSRINPRLALGGRNISVANKSTNRINEIAQLITGHILLTCVYGIKRSIQLRQQPIFLGSAERRRADAGD